ncbi:hypothetical protein GQX74_010527 [Glossina fuscipes]|nr:hypothetical protein GQX74_010527 [Glossina fuscipes]
MEKLKIISICGLFQFRFNVQIFRIYVLFVFIVFCFLLAGLFMFLRSFHYHTTQFTFKAYSGPSASVCTPDGGDDIIIPVGGPMVAVFSCSFSKESGTIGSLFKASESIYFNI